MNDEMKEACLLHLQEEFEKAGMECDMRSESVAGMGLKILTVNLGELGSGIDDVPGEFLFFPSPNGAEGTDYFMSVFTLTDSIVPIRIPTLAEYICRINSVSQMGAFVLSLDKRLLMFRMQTPLMGLDIEQMKTMTESLAVHALQSAEDFAGELVRYAEGIDDETVLSNLLDH